VDSKFLSKMNTSPKNGREMWVKILHWSHNGFWLYYRRLERGRFDWPETSDAKTMVITRRELNWLLDGLPLEQPKAHRAVPVRSTI